MAITLPSWTRTIDNAFTETWYDIKPDAVDNILNATPVTAALKAQGRMKTQRGGDLITETITYQTTGANVQGVGKGDVMEAAEVETETMARWTWRYIAAKLLRSTIKDQQNSGKYQIKSYVQKEIEKARDSLAQQFESDFFRAVDLTETAHKYMQSLVDIVPALTDAYGASKTYGLIQKPLTYSSGAPATGNTFWGPRYKQWTAPKEVNMLSDMKNLWNTLGANRAGAYPTLIITDQTTFELYEEFALDMSQIVKQGSGSLADLGFETLKFKGCDMIWSPNVPTAYNMYMFNLNKITWWYDPQYWFEMTEWKPIPNQFERAAQILCTCNLTCNELRRQGLLYA